MTHTNTRSTPPDVRNTLQVHCHMTSPHDWHMHQQFKGQHVRTYVQAHRAIHSAMKLFQHSDATFQPCETPISRNVMFQQLSVTWSFCQ